MATAFELTLEVDLGSGEEEILHSIRQLTAGL